jgi:tetratricopeptide (TPR) repeat protein
MTEEQRAEHNRAFEEATGIVKKEMPLDAREESSSLGWLVRRKLGRALSLFARVVQLNPANWSALWLMGKVHVRLGDFDAAFSCFERAHRANPRQPEVAREASRCAMDLGRHEVALDLAQRAVQLDPNNPTLRANLALACLIAGRIPDAQLAASQAVMGEPTDDSFRRLKAIVQHFAAKGTPPPATPPALFEYWRKISGD